MLSIDRTPPDRHVALAGVHNFRDLGGYPTVDGGTTRWRTLFRADGLDRLTADDLDVLRPMGLRTVIDLRTQHELDAGAFPVDHHPVTFHHLSILDQTWDRDDAVTDDLAENFLHQAYTNMLADGAARFATAFEFLAGQDALPAVFHCTAGKDRTGLLAALVLGTLGVPDDVIVEDYALTQASMDRIMERLRSDPEKAVYLDAVPAAFFAADPVAMARVIGDLVAAHGSIRGYVQSIGVGDDVIDHLSGQLLTGS